MNIRGNIIQKFGVSLASNKNSPDIVEVTLVFSFFFLETETLVFSFLDHDHYLYPYICINYYNIG